MKFFADTADVDAIRELNDLVLCDGAMEAWRRSLSGFVSEL